MTEHDEEDNTPLNDMVMVAALGFLLLFIAAYLQIRPPTADANAKMRAEILIAMDWPEGAFDDIDLWVMMPDGRKVNFRNREVDFVTLERDDLGAMNDLYTDANGQRKLTPVNREVMTIRALVPGRYIVAAHVYAARTQLSDYADGKLWTTERPLPYAATLEVLKLNPRLTEVLKAQVQLTEHGQEAVFAAFDIDADGNAVNVELNPSQYQIVDLVPLFGGDEAMR